MLRAPGSESPETAAIAEVIRADGTTAIFTPQIVTDPDSGLPVARTVVTIDDDIQEVSFKLPSPENTNVSSVTFTIGGAASAGRSAGRVLGSAGGSMQVTGSLFYGDPTDHKALEVFPGEFLTRDNVPSGASRRTAQSGGGEGILVTAGFTQIKLTDSTGGEITSFANGAEVGVVMRVPEGVFNPDTGAPVVEGDNVPIFTYDEAAGEWKVEYNSNGTIKRGTVMRDSDGMYVPFTTDHLSWFNLDWVGLTCPSNKPVIRAVDGAGKPIQRFTATIAGEGLGYRVYPRSTNDGEIGFYYAPADIPWSVTVEAEGHKSDPTPIVNCGDVTVALRELNAVSRTSVSAACGNSPYTNVNVYAFKEGVRIASGKTGADGAATLTLPSAAGIMIYSSSTDSCKDLKSEFLTTSAAGQQSAASFAFNNTCCAGYVEPLRISGLTPAKATGVNPEAAVSGTITFSKAVPASSVPALTITLKQGETTIIAGAAASTLGAVSWSDASGGTARTLSFTAARAADIQAGKTYSFTVGMTPSAVVATDGATLELASYLSTTSGVVSYTSASVTGSFSTMSGPANNPPVPDAGDDRDASIGIPVTLDGSNSSDPDDDPLTFKWALVSGPSAVISNSTSAVATFTPSVAGTYIFTLTVDDGRGGVVRDRLTITACSIFCSTNADCEDSDDYTVDTCLFPGTCSASCLNKNTFCSISLDKQNYEPGENIAVTFTGSNAETEPLECGAKARLEKADKTVVWISFDDDVFITIPPGQGMSQTFLHQIPSEWDATNTPAGTNYKIDPIQRDETLWEKGDNFNIIVARCKTIACETDAECADGLSYTSDTCINPGLCSSECVHDCEPACLNDSDCDDSDPLTVDECVNFVSCDPEVACSNVLTACSTNGDCSGGTPYCISGGTASAACVSCLNNAHCDDSDPQTIDVCQNPGQSNAACVNTPCVIECSSDIECDDSDPITVDECSNPGTCNASCNNCIPECENNSQCNDSDPLTIDVCENQNTCSAGCVNTPCVPVCVTHSDCNDNDPDTTDMCVNAGTCDAVCANNTNWITIPAGDFIMGCDIGGDDMECSWWSTESPKHTVTMSYDYMIHKTEVTNAQYKACVDATVCTAPWSFDSYSRSPYYGNAMYDNYPVINVDWNQARAYCAWTGGRLPSEAEWEKAARGPSPREVIYPWGNTQPDCSLANFMNDVTWNYCVDETSEAGSYSAGASYYGVLDMSGNVSEWVEDDYQFGDYTNAPTDGSAWIGSPRYDNRVVRGGAWGDHTSHIRVSFRLDNYLTNFDYGVGFRCVRD
jgi:formylglycine-generating enzyme required for sulfatase activity